MYNRDIYAVMSSVWHKNSLSYSNIDSGGALESECVIHAEFYMTVLKVTKITFVSIMLKPTIPYLNVYHALCIMI
jgi:hypothetical protein